MNRTVKKIAGLAISVMVAFVLISCQRQSATSAELSGNTVSVSTVVQKEGEYSEDQLNESYNEKEATVINLEESLSITTGGTYVVSGKLMDGQITVDAAGEDVWLVMDGVDITNSTVAPVYIEAAKNVYITIKDGSVNTLTDSKNNADGAVILSKADLTLNGSGELTINANGKDGVVGKDDVVVTNGIITINAEDDGMTGKDSISIKQGKFVITAGGDGIKSDNEEDETKGYVMIDGGEYKITAGCDAIQAEQSLYINDGKFEINTGDSNGNEAEESTTDAKGLKAGADLCINGGSFQINSKDDAIHSNGNITIWNGIFEIQSGDDGIHSSGTLEIDGGTISILESSEGIEGLYIIMNNGYVDITASDDGVNIAGGNDKSAVEEPGANGFSDVSEGTLTINGGEVYVNAQGDGLDSNGSILMTGGYVEVSGPVNDGNGALDYNGTFDISAGTLLVSGSAGMAQAPSEDATQKTIAAVFDNAITGGTKATITDETGEILYSITPEKEYKMVLVSGRYIEEGKAYTITAGTQSLTVTGGDLSGIATESGMRGGAGGPVRHVFNGY